MSRFLNLLVVAAVVLFSGACASELVAGTTKEVYAYTYTSNAQDVVAVLYKQEFFPPYWFGYNQQLVDGSYEPFELPVFQVTPLPPPMQNLNEYIYMRTLTDLTPVSMYRYVVYVRTGYGPGYTYTQLGGSDWTQ